MPPSIVDPPKFKAHAYRDYSPRWGTSATQQYDLETERQPPVLK